MATTTKAHERRDLERHAQQMLARYIEDGATIYTQTNYSPRRDSTTAHVRVFVVADGSIEELTFYVARAYGEHGSVEHGIRTTGGGYNRGLHVIEMVRAGLQAQFDTTNGPRVIVDQLDAEPSGDDDEFTIGWSEL